jgi:hypothetical protein
MRTPMITSQDHYLVGHNYHIIKDEDLKGLEEDGCITGSSVAYVRGIGLIEDNAVTVKLNLDQVRDILEGERHADWICDLQATVDRLVRDGLISLKQTYACEATQTVTRHVSGHVEATSRDEAIDKFLDAVHDDPKHYTDSEEAETDDMECYPE